MMRDEGKGETDVSLTRRESRIILTLKYARIRPVEGRVSWEAG